MTAHVPTESNAAQATRKLIREISIFLIGIGLFYAVLGAVCIALIPPEAAPIQGIPRGFFFGVPLFVFAAIHLMCGILLWTTGKTVFGAIGAVASALVCVMAFIFTGFSLINCLFAAAPILIAQRLALIAKNRADDAAVLPYR